MRKTVSLSSVLVLIATTAHAGAHLPGRCQGLDTKIDGDADRAFQCIADLENELERLSDIEAQLAALRTDLDAILRPLNDRLDILEFRQSDLNMVPATGNHPETKAIVAFTSAKGEKTCPEGWSPFEEAKDRFIVGAGGKYPTVEEIGGEETVTLSVEQMPTHRHIQTWGQGHGVDPAAWGNNLQKYKTESLGYTRSEGGNEAHNNMPPYIVLYFCKKD